MVFLGRLIRAIVRRVASAFAALILLAVLVSVTPILTLRWLDPPTTSFMLLQDGPLRELSYEWRDREEISRNLVWAVISAEDQKFLTHKGFDFASIRNAVDDYRAGDDLRGASTITQQVAKNLFLWPEQSLVRKGIEAYLTVVIELCWPKERILEVYLNIAEFSEGVFGAEAAARRVFGSSAAELTSAQAALLAAVLPNPKRLDARSPDPYLRGRQAWILAQMRRVAHGADASTLSWPVS